MILCGIIVRITFGVSKIWPLPNAGTAAQKVGPVLRGSW